MRLIATLLYHLPMVRSRASQYVLLISTQDDRKKHWNMRLRHHHWFYTVRSRVCMMTSRVVEDSQWRMKCRTLSTDLGEPWNSVNLRIRTIDDACKRLQLPIWKMDTIYTGSILSGHSTSEKRETIAFAIRQDHRIVRSSTKQATRPSSFDTGTSRWHNGAGPRKA